MPWSRSVYANEMKFNLRPRVGRKLLIHYCFVHWVQGTHFSHENGRAEFIVHGIFMDVKRRCVRTGGGLTKWHCNNWIWDAVIPLNCAELELVRQISFASITGETAALGINTHNEGFNIRLSALLRCTWRVVLFSLSFRAHYFFIISSVVDKRWWCN